MTRRVLGAAAVAAAVAGALPAGAGPAGAGPKPPVKRSYEVTNPVPAPHGGDLPGAGCHEGQEGTTAVKLPGKGVLKVELTGFAGDWDLLLVDSRGKVLGESASDNGIANTGISSEKITYKKAAPGQQVSIVACNWAGGPRGTVAYTFTYA